MSGVAVPENSNAAVVKKRVRRKKLGGGGKVLLAQGHRWGSAFPAAFWSHDAGKCTSIRSTCVVASYRFCPITNCLKQPKR